MIVAPVQTLRYLFKVEGGRYEPKDALKLDDEHVSKKLLHRVINSVGKTKIEAILRCFPFNPVSKYSV
jgi:hypothetical protein